MRALPVFFAMICTCVCVCVCVVVLGAGCLNPALPPGAQVSCESNAGCPPGTICGGPLERCVADVGDETPPALVDAPEVSPKAGKSGTTFAITLVASEPLGRPPAVGARMSARSDGGVDEAEDGDDVGPAIPLPPFRLVSDDEGEDGDRRTYRFEYTAFGNEPEGIATIGAELVDESGLVAQVTVDSFELDFVPPRFLESTLLEGRLAKAGTIIALSITFSELLSDDIESSVFMPEQFGEKANLDFTPRDALDDVTEIFEYVVTGNEIEGTRPVYVSLVDRVGNNGQGVEGAGGGAVETPIVITLDFTPPQPSDSAIDTTPHGADELITLSVAFDEIIRDETVVGGDVVVEGAPSVYAVLRGGDPLVDVLPLDVRHEITGDFVDPFTRLTLEHRVRACDRDGIYDVVMDNVIDLAGNESDGVRDGWFFVLERVACP